MGVARETRARRGAAPARRRCRPRPVASAGRRSRPRFPSRPRPARGRSAHALALIVVLAAAVRFATLGVPSYWLDEWVTVHETHGGFSAVLDSVHGAEGGPPLYLIAIWTWQKVFGGSEIVVRSFSALLGT